MLDAERTLKIFVHHFPFRDAKNIKSMGIDLILMSLQLGTKPSLDILIPIVLFSIFQY